MKALLKSLSVALLALTATPALAEYPEKNVALVVHTGAGGPFDTLSRKLGEMLTQELGWSVRVENRQGSNGVIALTSIMREPADGYTLLGAGNVLSFNLATGRTEVPVEDLELLVAFQWEPSALVVRADSPLTSVEDYVASLKETPDGLRVGGSGQGGNDFAHGRLNQLAEVQSTWVPFPSAPEGIVALVGGHIDAGFFTPSSVLAQVESGELKLLAVSSEERSAFYPDVPTFSEAGFDIDFRLWRGFAMRKGADPQVVEAIRAAFDKIKATEEWVEFTKAQQQMDLDLEGEAFEAFFLKEIEGYRAFYGSN